jgi:hypothetical protein
MSKAVKVERVERQLSSLSTAEGDNELLWKGPEGSKRLLLIFNVGPIDDPSMVMAPLAILLSEKAVQKGCEKRRLCQPSE